MQHKTFFCHELIKKKSPPLPRDLQKQHKKQTMVEKTGKDSEGFVTHKLEDKWTLWFEKRETGTKQQLTEQEWDSSLQNVGSFDTLEGYFMYYSHLQRPSELGRQTSYYLFRKDLKPTWENYPEGGHWTVTLQKSFDPEQLNRLWEQMSFALIGEEFNSPHLVGGVLSIKKDCCTLSVWSDQAKTKYVRMFLGIKNILSFCPFPFQFNYGD